MRCNRCKVLVNEVFDYRIPGTQVWVRCYPACECTRAVLDYYDRDPSLVGRIHLGKDEETARRAMARLANAG